ncbi:hypothetical protein MTR67_018118 [Solanum verrucosum]|uniref:Reverse transcriptase Ty1/copia-type domain-containing protein n=1 Tax=Solanum verrucosum TaxID=315347 RepID=A0AAF0QKD9_SOLVR|nr:hypothetical protein MTR67_018118 [Solanum verrucosum]
MEQQSRFVAQGESRLVCKLRPSLYGLKQFPREWFGRVRDVVQHFGMIRTKVDHSVFHRHSSFSFFFMTRETRSRYPLGAHRVKPPLLCNSSQPALGKPSATNSTQKANPLLSLARGFELETSKMEVSSPNHWDTPKGDDYEGIEVAQSGHGIAITQRKYALDILEDVGMLGCKQVDSPMDPNTKLIPRQGEPLKNRSRYWRLVGKLNYLTITRPDISFVISVVSQFLQSPCDSPWNAVIRILRYIKSSPGQGLLYEDKGHTNIV